MKAKILSISILLIPFFMGLSCSATKTMSETGAVAAGYFQKQILQTIQSGPQLRQKDDVYYWPKASNPQAVDSVHLGTTVNIDYMGERLSSVRENRGSHCVGVSWQVCMSVLQEWSHRENGTAKISGMAVGDMKDFVDKWFVELKGAPLAEPLEMGSVYALTSYGLGIKIPFENAQAGDFVQFWRKDDSGHSCIFLHWVYDKKGQITGFKYWGSQPGTNGIGTNTEYFSVQELDLKPEKLLQKERFYIARLMPITN